MRTTTTLLPSLFATALLAQPYRPFPEANATWVSYNNGIVGSGGGGLCSEVWGSFHRVIRFGNDSTFNGHTYHTMLAGDDGTQFCPGDPGWSAPYHNDFYEAFYIRQDTVERKVHGAWPGTTDEWLVYDFSGDVGDTIHLQYSDMIVDSIYMMPLGDGDHRAFDLVCIGCGLIDPTTTMIEGIGATLTVSPAWDIGSPFEYVANLECFKLNDTVIFTDTIDGPPICDVSIVMAAPERSATGSLSVHPNPAVDVLILDGDIPPGARYVVFNALGELTDEGMVQGTRMACDAWPAGMHLLMLTSANGIVLEMLRVIKQ